jgi:exonuclease VII large subunit
MKATNAKDLLKKLVEVKKILKTEGSFDHEFKNILLIH